MAYTKTVWVNNEEPSIDATNLNKMEQGIYDAQFPDEGDEGQILARGHDGLEWIDPPNSAVWGGITGDIADQTDLQAALSSVGKVDSVNGIEPDVYKNVQVDVEVTQAEYDALPSSKNTDDINYYINDGNNNPVNNTVMASGVAYDNTSSGLTADDVQDAIDENASAISSLSAGLTPESTQLSYTAGTNISIRSHRFIRVGKIVFVDVYFDTTATIANNAHIIDFPTKLPKPINKYAIGACRSVAGDFALVSIEDNNSNYVAAWGPIPAGTYYYAQMVYVTRE